jgi:hypothetical protein
VVTSTVNGRFPAGELMLRDPQLFATSTILGDADKPRRNVWDA